MAALGDGAMSVGADAAGGLCTGSSVACAGVSGLGDSVAEAGETAAAEVELACVSLAGAVALLVLVGAPVCVCSLSLVAPAAGMFSSVAMKTLLDSSRFAAARGAKTGVPSGSISSVMRPPKARHVQAHALLRGLVCRDAGVIVGCLAYEAGMRAVKDLERFCLRYSFRPARGSPA